MIVVIISPPIVKRFVNYITVEERERETERERGLFLAPALFPALFLAPALFPALQKKAPGIRGHSRHCRDPTSTDLKPVYQ